MGAQDTQDAPDAGSDAPSDALFESFLAALASSPPPYRPPVFQAGDVFADRYRVERELGRGGMGTVYLATDLDLGRKVALKVALGRRAEAELERLQQEATIMAGLSHPGIVTVFEATAAGDDVYIVLEFVPGGTLRDWIDVGGHGWREIVSRFVEVANALSAAHAAGVVHRDFKPANVLLDLDGNPRIADFGLARSEGPLDTQEMRLLQSSATTQTGAVMGTPAYMAPEQGRGEAATAASDQFSFFVALYEAICGRRPFEGKTLLQLMDEIEAGPPRRYPGMPRALVEPVKRGLAFRPAGRHQDMAAVSRALRSVLTARRRKLQLSVLSLGVIGASAFGFIAAPKAAAPCQRDQLSATVDGVWAAARSQVNARSGEPTARALDDYRDAVVDERVAACEAHTLRSDLSDIDFALRSACLDRAEARFGGLVEDLLANPRPLAGASTMLPAPEACTDTVALRRYANALAPRSSHDDATQDRANLESIRLLTQAKLQAMRGADFAPLAREVIDLAERHGLSTSKAEALLLLASRATSDEANALLDQAVAAAGEAPAPEFLADVAVQRASIALQAEDAKLARVHLAHAESLARLGAAPAARDQLERDLLRQRIAVATQDTAESVEALDRIVAQLPEAGAHRRQALRLRADALLDRNRLEEAARAYLALLPEARDAFERLSIHVNRAISLRRAGRAAEAKAALERGREAYAEPLSAELEGHVRIGEGAIAILEGRLADATERLEGTHAILSEVDPAHPLLGDVWYHQARLALLKDEPRVAFEASNAALAHWDRVHGPGSWDAARTLLVMSEALRALGHADQAAEAAKVAVGLFRDQSRPADEIALAELTQARAVGEANAEARRICEASELAQCREPLAASAQTALSH